MKIHGKGMQKKIKKAKKAKSISQLKKIADSVFSHWIRERDKACVTCGSTERLQNGHYISRSINVLRFSEVNCNCQCMVCNVFKSGNMAEYSAFMRRKHGPDIIEKLLKSKQTLYQFKRSDLELIIEKYSPTQTKSV